MAAVPQRILNWLYSVLTSEYHDVNRTYNDVAQALSHYSSLSPRTDVHTYENGASALLLHLSGTLPVAFRGTTYRFPVSIWIPHAYPCEAPLVYVTPVEGMMVRAGQHVDPQGKIYHPYLAGWPDYMDKSNLLDFLAILRDVFAKEPPVIAKPPQNAQPMSPSPAASVPPPRPPLPHELARPASVASNASQERPPPPPPKPGGIVERTQSPSVYSPQRRYDEGPPLPPLPGPITNIQRSMSSAQNPTYAQQIQPQRHSSLRYDSGPPLSPQLQRQESLQSTYSPVSPMTPDERQPSYNQSPQPLQQYNSPPPQSQQIPQQYVQQYSQPYPQQYPQQQQQQQQFQNSQQWQPQQQQHTQAPPPQPKPQPPPDLLDAPLTLALPPEQSNLPAPPVPPNPEKDMLLSTLAKSLHQHRQQSLSQTISSLPGLHAQNTAMLASLQMMQAELATLDALKSTLDSNSAILHKALHDADAVIADSQHRKPPAVDDILVAPNAVGNQLYELVSEERALGDAIFVLGRAVERGVVSGPVFVKQTRALAREWFLKKALVAKIGRGMGLDTVRF